MMKRIRIIIGILLAVLLLIASAASVFADTETDTDTETETGIETETEEPTEPVQEETEHVHSYVTVSAHEPTCTEEGNSEYWTCSECGEFFSYDGEKYTVIDEGSWLIPALGHNFQNRTCTRCGAREDGWYKGSDGSWYYYSDNVAVTGWIKSGGIWYWLDENGRMQTGWQQIDGEWYFFDSSGAMLKGWLKRGVTWYYLRSSGEMAIGWEKVNGIWYYFNSQGAMQTGWKKIDGKWYLLQASGAMYRGWYKSGSIWYYLTSSGAMATTWEKVNGKWYYFNSSGAMQTGWQKVNGKWYYLSASGAMQTGWFRQGKNLYYLKPSGVMAIGLTDIDGKKYYFSSAGTMQTGWQLIDGYWYYFYYSGEMAIDGIVLDKWYIRDGRIDYNYTGIAADYDGSWYIRRGSIDTSFTGTVSSNGIEYNVVNGMVTSPVNKFYFGTLFSSVARDGNIHFGTTGSQYEVECVHACYCDVHEWTNPSTGHLGVDLICSTPGKELLAVASGTVVYVHHQSYENDGSYGSHPGEAVAVYVGNGVIYEYHELKSNSVHVSVGDHVNAGDVIGKVGLTGVTTGYHIHFSVLYWLGAEYTDDFSKMPEYEGPSTDGYIQINPLFFFGEALAKQAEEWYPAHKYEWYGYKNTIPGDPRNYPKLASRLLS